MKMRVINRIELIFHPERASNLWERAKTRVSVVANILNFALHAHNVNNNPNEIEVMKNKNGATEPTPEKRTGNCLRPCSAENRYNIVHGILVTPCEG